MARRFDDPLFLKEKKRHGHFLLTVCLLLLLAVAVSLLVNAFNNRIVRLNEQSVTMPSMPKAFEKFRILHISDLHGARFGDGQEAIMTAIKNASYDVVCISGDMASANGDFTALTELIEALPQNVPIYFVAGDEDPDPILMEAHATNNVKAEYVLAAEKRGAIYLDAPAQIKTSGGKSIWLCPDAFLSIDLKSTERALTDYQAELIKKPSDANTEAALRAVEYRLDTLKRSEEARQKMLSDDLYIVLTHVPYTENALQNLLDSVAGDQSLALKRVNLVLAGHYNNGQFRLPFLGAVWLPESLGAADHSAKLSGLRVIRGVSQYVSPGLGAAKIYTLLPWRFFNPPAVTLITLTTALTQ